MEQEKKRLADQRRSDAVKWAVDVLGVAMPNPADSDKVTRRQAVASFFDCLKADGFYVEADKIEAVQVVLGAPNRSSFAYQQHLRQRHLLQLDGLVEWFASHLGVMPENELLTSMKNRLSHLKEEELPAKAQRYSKNIWQTCLAVDRNVVEREPAEIKLLQALFHISTVRATERCRVRSRWLEKLRCDFSVAELVTAKNAVLLESITPGNQFHRPFLFSLTRQGTCLDQLRLPPPVDSRRYTSGVTRTVYRDLDVTSSGFDLFVKYSFLLILVLVGIAFVVHANGSAFKPEDASNIELNEATEPRVVEALEVISQQPPEKASQGLFPSDLPVDAADANFDPIRNPSSTSNPDSALDKSRSPNWDGFSSQRFDHRDIQNPTGPSFSPGGIQ